MMQEQYSNSVDNTQENSITRLNNQIIISEMNKDSIKIKNEDHQSKLVQYESDKQQIKYNSDPNSNQIQQNNEVDLSQNKLYQVNSPQLNQKKVNQQNPINNNNTRYQLLIQQSQPQEIKKENNQILADNQQVKKQVEFKPIQIPLISIKNKKLNQQKNESSLEKSETQIISPARKKESSLTKSSNQLKLSQYRQIDMNPGEQILVSEDSSLVYTNTKDDGKIIFTNYRLAFITVDKKKIIDVPIGYIFKLQRNVSEYKNTTFSTIDIFMKHGILYKFKFNVIEFSDKIFKIIGKFVFCMISQVFAFTYAKAKNVHKNLRDLELSEVARINGWDLNWRDEYQRMGIDFGSKKHFQIIDNESGRLCSSYPQFFIIPASITTDTLTKCLKIRSKQKIPILSYAIPFNQQKNINYSCLWRASNIKMQSNNVRNIADEEYLRILGNLTEIYEQNTPKNLIIYDIKQKASIINSSAKTFLSIENYRNATLKTLELQSLVSIKQSYNKIISACLSNQPTKWLKLIEQTKWYEQVSILLKQSLHISNNLQKQVNILVQFHENIERSAQVCALVQIMLDPYYRSLVGFTKLIDKQFSWLGYPFSLRLGIKKQREQQRAPTFIQFLDCVHQLIYQFPLSFEFTSKYLARIAYELYSNKYGNFLSSSRKQQKQEYKIQYNSISIWNQINNQGNRLYTNPYFVGPRQSDIYDLRPEPSVKSMIFWKDHFFKFTTPLKQSYSNGFLGVQQNKDYINILHKQIKAETEQLRKIVSSQYTIINQLKSELRGIQDNMN